jgi:hypothetical protein
MAVALAPSASSQAVIADVVRSMTADLDTVAHQLTESIHGNIAELEPDLLVGTRESCRSNLGMIMTMLGEGTRPSLAVPPPEALSYAKEYVHRGHGFELLQRAYRTAQGRFCQLWLDALRVRADDAEELAETFGYFNDWLFAWVETLENRLTGYYMGERERYLRGTTAMRAEIVRAILEGAPQDVPTTSARLRYELDRRHLAFIIWTEEADGVRAHGHTVFGAMERLAGETAELLGAADHLIVPLHGYLACWAGFRGRPSETPPEQLPSAGRRRLHVAFGQPGHGVPGFRRSHEEALLARDVSRLASSGAATCVSFDDVALDALLTHDRAEARRFVEDQLGELAQDSDATNRLRATLAVFLQQNASFLHAAQRLGVHENTVAYRIRRAEELLGCEVRSNRVELQAALRLSRLKL